MEFSWGVMIFVWFGVLISLFIPGLVCIQMDKTLVEKPNRIKHANCGGFDYSRMGASNE